MTTGEKFYTFRHIRKPMKVNGVTVESNLGGVSVYVCIHQDQHLLEFSLAVNDDNQNFNKHVAQQITEGRFKAAKTVLGSYDRTKSLVDNIIEILESLTGHGASALACAVPAGQREAALNRLRSFTKKLPRAQFTGERRPRSVDAANWPFPTASRPN